MVVVEKQYQVETDERFEKDFDYIAAHKETEQKLFFDGQIYAAFSLLVNLVGTAKEDIILLDNFVDIKTLNILEKKMYLFVFIL